jgi:hypothetical protein
MDSPERMIVEVNGMKLDVDMRTARRIDTLQIGSRVKVLTKSPYESSVKIRPGVVAAFEPFPSKPSIVVAVLDISYSEAKLEFLTYNADSKDVEVIASIDDDMLTINRADVHSRIEREIATKQREIEDLERRRDWFDVNFAAYFVNSTSAEVANG